jgi:hypothetical protein
MPVYGRSLVAAIFVLAMFVTVGATQDRVKGPDRLIDEPLDWDPRDAVEPYKYVHKEHKTCSQCQAKWTAILVSYDALDRMKKTYDDKRLEWIKAYNDAEKLGAELKSVNSIIDTFDATSKSLDPQGKKDLERRFEQDNKFSIAQMRLRQKALSEKVTFAEKDEKRLRQGLEPLRDQLRGLINTMAGLFNGLHDCEVLYCKKPDPFLQANAKAPVLPACFQDERAREKFRADVRSQIKRIEDAEKEIKDKFGHSESLRREWNLDALLAKLEAAKQKYQQFLDNRPDKSVCSKCGLQGGTLDDGACKICGEAPAHGALDDVPLCKKDEQPKEAKSDPAAAKPDENKQQDNDQASRDSGSGGNPSIAPCEGDSIVGQLECHVTEPIGR